MIKIYAIKTKEKNNDCIFNKCLTFLSDEKRCEIRKYHNPMDAQRALLSDILIRTIICKSTNIKNSDIIFLKNKYGKPSLVNHPNFHFNISHSNQWVVCATHCFHLVFELN